MMATSGSPVFARIPERSLSSMSCPRGETLMLYLGNFFWSADSASFPMLAARDQIVMLTSPPSLPEAAEHPAVAPRRATAAAAARRFRKAERICVTPQNRAGAPSPRGSQQPRLIGEQAFAQSFVQIGG